MPFSDTVYITLLFLAILSIQFKIKDLNKQKDLVIVTFEIIP